MLVAQDEHQELIALEWVQQGRRFPGFVTWYKGAYYQMTYGDMIAFFEDLARQADPFGNYPIVYLKPQR